jgi:hypothetical protein
MNSVISYKPNEYECERASSIYLMSVVIVMVGLPIPIINLIATIIVYLSNRDSTFYVKWHSLQALLSQLFVAIFNSIGFGWTMTILFTEQTVSPEYFGYVCAVLVLNVIEFFATVYAAILVRKGQHLEFWIFGPLVHIVHPK